MGVRPEGFILADDGKLELELKGLEVMGRDTTIVSKHDSCENTEIRSIVSAETTINNNAGTVRFNLKPNKTYIFDGNDESRLYT